MKSHQFLPDIELTLWFAWFAIVGIAIAMLLNWIFSANIQKDDLLVAGSVTGIITGGIAVLILFVIGKTRKQKGFGKNLRQ